MRKMAQKMIAIAVAMVIVLGMASVTQMDTLAAWRWRKGASPRWCPPDSTDKEELWKRRWAFLKS